MGPEFCKMEDGKPEKAKPTFTAARDYFMGSGVTNNRKNKHGIQNFSFLPQT